MEKSILKMKRMLDSSSTRNGDDDGNDVQPEKNPISFSVKDFAITGPNVPLPMVIRLQINNFSVHRVFVNDGSTANILYWSAFLKMRLSESMLKPFKALFRMDTIGETASVKGYIDLDTTFGKGGNNKMIKVRYLVVVGRSVYNVVIGRSTVAELGAVISTLHLTMKYPLGDGMVGVVKADLDMARKCCNMFPNAII